MAAKSQHVLQLLRSGGDQRNPVLLLILLHLPETNDELRLGGIIQTWRTERRRRNATSVILLYETAPCLSPGGLTQTHNVEFTCRTHQADTGQVSRVAGGVHPSHVPTHRCANQMKGSLIQADALHKLHRQRSVTYFIQNISVSTRPVLLCSTQAFSLASVQAGRMVTSLTHSAHTALQKQLIPVINFHEKHK